MRRILRAGSELVGEDREQHRVLPLAVPEIRLALDALSDESGAEEEGDQPDDNGLIEALAKELKGQRWDADKSVWK